MLRPAIVSGTGIVSRKAVFRVIIAHISTTPPQQATARMADASGRMPVSAFI
jgi:hypothetical protein